MEKANQASVFDLEFAACEIIDIKNLLTAVQWWMDKLMECKTEKDAGTVFAGGGENLRFHPRYSSSESRTVAAEHGRRR